MFNWLPFLAPLLINIVGRTFRTNELSIVNKKSLFHILTLRTPLSNLFYMLVHSDTFQEILDN